MNNFKVIFVHCYDCSSYVAWYPRIAGLLKENNIDFSIPDMPGGEFPEAKEWVKVIHKEVYNSDKPVILVGHSIGTRAILLYLEEYMTKVPKVFLIGALANRLENAQRREGKLANFFDHKINVDKIEHLVQKFVVIHSKDDDRVGFEQAEELTKELDAELVAFEDRKHFLDEGDADVLFEVVKRELGF